MGEIPVAAEVVDEASRALHDVGSRIRTVRSLRGKTLSDLAGETGISTSMLSMLERGVAAPSIGTLVAVAAALGLPMVKLFERQDREPAAPVRRLSDQLTVELASGVLRRLALTDTTKGIEMVVNEYQPGTDSHRTPVRHGGTEYGLILAGTLQIEVNDVTHRLKQGDGITYSSREPHRISNPGKSLARAVWLNLS